MSHYTAIPSLGGGSLAPGLLGFLALKEKSRVPSSEFRVPNLDFDSRFRMEHKPARAADKAEGWNLEEGGR